MSGGGVVHFRRAVTSEAKPLIGLYAESGRGKTYSALLLAKGFAGDMAKVGMIDTEAGRGEAFADDPVVGGYNVLPIRGEFPPRAYGTAIAAAEAEGLQVLIVDSASHEWEGLGGVLAMAAANQADGKKGVLIWQQPKIEHARQFMLRLQQTPIPLVIVCMRAKYPMKEASREDAETWRQKGRPGKPPSVGDWIRSDQLEPKQSDDILFEMFVHGWIDEGHCLHVTKWTRDNMRTIFTDGQPISVETGKRLAAWASGRPTSTAPAQSAATARPASSDLSPEARAAATDAGLDVDVLMATAREFAECGLDRFREHWASLGDDVKRVIGTERRDQLKDIAAKVPT